MDRFWKDVKFSIHSLRTNPGFALVSILTLALGIGATTAIFSVVNGVLLRPLPLHDPSRLVMVWEAFQGNDNGTSPATYHAWEAESKRLFASIGGTFDWEMSVTGHGEPELVRVGLATGSLFPTLGASPYLGRVITDGASTDAVLSHALWQRKFGGDPKVIGKSVGVDDNTVTIVGVMSREFLVPGSQAEMWVPYEVPAQWRGRFLRVIGRLAPGVTQEQAQAGMTAIHQRLAKEFPQFNTGWSVNVIPVHEQVVGSVRRGLLIVMAAVGFLLLIGCVNIANLLLSRATTRAKEMSIRAAVGASRGQLIRQLLTESLILASIAGALGVVIAGWATMLLVRFTPESAMIPRTGEIGVDGGVLAVAAVLTLATGVFFGLAPAIEASRTNLQSGLVSSSRGATQDRARKALRNTLVIAEVALATVLLVGAGLLIKSFATLERVDSGVKAEGVLTMRVVLPEKYEENEQRRVMMGQMLENIGNVPGVERVGAIINMPFTPALSRQGFAIEGAPPPPPGQGPSADIRAIAGEYFRAMGIPIKAGRVFNPGETGRTEVVVNDAFARQHFPAGTSPVGRRLLFEWFAELNAEIVGVVGSVRAAGLETDAAPAIYLSYLYDPNRQFTLAIASSTNPMSLQVPVTHTLRSLEPTMPVDTVKTLEDLISGTIARPRFNATMLSLFAFLGLLLASIGIYGVLSYSVTQRTNEMGIRMALGADPGDVLRLVVRDGATVAIIGIAIGLAAALPTTKVLAALLYGVDTFDLQVFATVALTLAAVALVASYIPARRATRVDPMIALRSE